MKNEYTTIKEVEKMMNYLENFEVYNPLTLIKKVVGYTLIGYGVGTSFILFSGSYFAIMGGCLLVDIDYKKLLKTISFYGKNILNWFYSNRSIKLIKYNLKLRKLK